MACFRSQVRSLSGPPNVSYRPLADTAFAAGAAKDSFVSYRPLADTAFAAMAAKDFLFSVSYWLTAGASL